MAAPGSFPYQNEIIALTDPFSEEAANARYPDQGSGRTLTFQQRQSLPIGTDANGQSFYAFNVKPNFPNMSFSSAAGLVVTWQGNWTGNFSTNLINTYGMMYRPTSMGVRIANTLSATDSAGYVIIAKGSAPPAGGVTTYNPSNFTSWAQHPFVHGGEWHLTLHPRTSNAYDMKDRATYATANAVDDTWETLYVGLSGSKASATPLLIETYTNYEYVPIQSSPIAQLAIAQPVLNTQIQTAVNEIQSAHPPVHIGTRSKVSNFVKQEAKKAILKHVLPFTAKKAANLLL